MRIKLRIPALIAVIAMTLTVTSSCVFSINKPKKPAKVETETSETETEEVNPDDDYDIVVNNFSETVSKYFNRAGDADFGGTSVMIATPVPSLTDEDNCGAVIAKDVAARNRIVKERYNVEIFTKEADPDTMYSEVSAACLSGDFYADILMIPQYYVSQYAVSGLLFNLNSLPFKDFTSGFNIPTGTEAAMAASSGYAVGGWATLDPDGLPAVFFNKDAVKEAGLDEPYDLVDKGEWTWDEFFRYSAAVKDVNSKRYAEGKEALNSYGAQNTATWLADIVYFSEGNRFITAGLGNPAAVTMSYENSYHAVTNAQTLYNDPYKNFNSVDAIKRFSDGSSMFLIDKLGTMKAIASSDAEWGVLPIPKGSAEQEKYYSLVPADALLFGVPSNSTSSEKVSRVITGLNIASMGYKVDAYVTDSMYYYLRDNRSTDSVEKICYGAVYDMAYSFGGYDINIANSTYFALRNVYEENHDIQYYLNLHINGAGTALWRLFQ